MNTNALLLIKYNKDINEVLTLYVHLEPSSKTNWET